MLPSFRPLAAAALFALVFACAPSSLAQERDEFGEAAADPVKLFNQGQDAHARKEYELALEFYEEALKLRPEFPEAEHQRGVALVALKRLPEAEAAFRRAMQLRPAWALPPLTLGLALAREPGRAADAEALLRRVLEIDAKSTHALSALAEFRARAGDKAEALALLRRATDASPGDAALWLARGAAEREAKDNSAAVKSFERALAIEPSNTAARMVRAELLIESGDAARASEELKSLEAAAKSDASLLISLANLYGMAGRAEDAQRVYESLPEEAKASDAGRRLGDALRVRCEDTQEARESLEKLVARDPKNASALACLGKLYRTSAPERSLEYYGRAARLKPDDADYATGYAAALIQLRRFTEAAGILQQVLKAAPEHYEAHANFAAALYELKLYKQAIVEYKWIERARPELAIVHFLTGTAHDRLGEFEEALA
ncbi:MAG TPA: tetratricopeptide repeat protein, partial [Pyrinomonadaceae bacterium]|nr:tetratricopeptide repeat protein [Pyrinomonadaceae bacterium]